jgi:RNA polymerase sigma-70 factor (ECF subfamily)
MPPPTEPVSSALEPPAQLSRWFAEEVHAHEPALRSYVQGKFPGMRDIDDVVQESFLRVWQARLARPIISSKAFLFTVARHVAFDLARRARRSPLEPCALIDEVPAAVEQPTAAESMSWHEKIDLLGRAIAQLPARRREVVLLHKIDGLSQREVAQRLGLSEKTVENHVALGVRDCEAFFRDHGVEFF